MAQKTKPAIRVYIVYCTYIIIYVCSIKSENNKVYILNLNNVFSYSKDRGFGGFEYLVGIFVKHDRAKSKYIINGNQKALI